MIRLIMLLILSSLSLVAFANSSLHDFQSDGCTMFVDGPPSAAGLWRHCCFEHDLRYWFGGTIANRDHTDLELRQCVNEVAGPNWAEVVYRGVTWGHLSPMKSKTQWSWGWTPARENSKLTKEEIAYVEEKLQELPLDPEYLKHFIKKYLDPLKQNP
jgi:hypothetical protein